MIQKLTYELDFGGIYVMTIKYRRIKDYVKIEIGDSSTTFPIHRIEEVKETLSHILDEISLYEQQNKNNKIKEDGFFD